MWWKRLVVFMLVQKIISFETMTITFPAHKRRAVPRRRVAVAPSLAALAPSLAVEEPSPHPIAVAPRRPSPSCSRRAVALSIAVAPRRPSPPCSRRVVPCRARGRHVAVAPSLAALAPSLAFEEPSVR